MTFLAIQGCSSIQVKSNKVIAQNVTLLKKKKSHFLKYKGQYLFLPSCPGNRLYAHCPAAEALGREGNCLGLVPSLPFRVCMTLCESPNLCQPRPYLHQQMKDSDQMTANVTFRSERL